MNRLLAILPWLITASIVFLVAAAVTRLLPRFDSLSLLHAASAGFVVLAVSCGAARSWYGRLVTLGLALCVVGDYFMARIFHYGVTAFLLGQVCFIGGFVTRNFEARRLLRSAPLVLVSLVILHMLWPYVSSNERALVAGYLTVITVMVVMAVAAATGWTGRFACAAALLFYLSDLFVAVGRYFEPGPASQRLWIPFYYAACILFAWSTSSHKVSDPSQDGAAQHAPAPQVDD